MRGAVTVQIEFCWPMMLPGGLVAELDCRASASVTPGEPCRPWQDDPGSGPEVDGYTDIEVWNGDAWIDADWLKPRILAYLEHGAENDALMDEADERGRGPDPDYIRDMRRDMDMAG